ncbi:MAG: SDR family oxidoreductase [Gammaproteobacteria bacterium]|nr:SDR family oxidoreductase [Gammaproteobacteria bacterium]
MNKSKVALVTGCNGDIGRALCKAFSSSGFIVVGTDLHLDSHIEVPLYLQCDLFELANDERVQNEFQLSVMEFAASESAEVNVIINNAAHQVVKPLGELSSDQFNFSQQVNVIAPFVMARIFEMVLRKSHGTILNIGSVHSGVTKPGFTAYATSKSGLSGLTRSLAIEFGGDVTVNTIAPGATETTMLIEGFSDNPSLLSDLERYHPAKRIGQPNEIAALALFLASEKARFITGSEIPIDGGISGRLHDPV